MPTQIDTSTNSDTTATPAGAQVVVAPSDASALVLYFGNNGPELADAQSPYTAWTKQGIGSATTRNSQAFAGHTGDDNLDIIVTSPSSGPFYFTAARSGNSWSLTAVGATGDPNNAATGGVSAAMATLIDQQGRIWYVGVDDAVATYTPAAGDRSGGAWTIDTTLEAVSLGEQNHRGLAAAIIGNYLVVVYDSGSGGLKYLRRDVHAASLGSWSAAAAVTGVSGISTASTLSLRAIPGGNTGMLAYTDSGGIKALVYDAGADTWGSITTLSSATSDRHPALIAGASGVVYAVWAQFAAANSYALVGQAYNGTWGSLTTLEASGNNIAWPSGGYLSSGPKLALVWTQGTASPWVVEFDAVNAPATPGGAIIAALGGTGGLGNVQAQTIAIAALGGVGGLGAVIPAGAGALCVITDAPAYTAVVSFGSTEGGGDVNSYDIGAQAVFTAKFYNSQSVLTDPGNVTCTLRSPAGIDTTPPAVRQGTGTYQATVDLTGAFPGVWWVRFAGTSPAQAAEESSFYVEASNV